MLRACHRDEVVGVVVAPNVIDVVDDDLRSQIFLAVYGHQVRTVGVGFPKVPFSDQPMLRDISQRGRKWMFGHQDQDVAPCAAGASTLPLGVRFSFGAEMVGGPDVVPAYEAGDTPSRLRVASRDSDGLAASATAEVLTLLLGNPLSHCHVINSIG